MKRRAFDRNPVALVPPQADRMALADFLLWLAQLMLFVLAVSELLDRARFWDPQTELMALAQQPWFLTLAAAGLLWVLLSLPIGMRQWRSCRRLWRAQRQGSAYRASPNWAARRGLRLELDSPLRRQDGRELRDPVFLRLGRFLYVGARLCDCGQWHSWLLDRHLMDDEVWRSLLRYAMHRRRMPGQANRHDAHRGGGKHAM